MRLISTLLLSCMFSVTYSQQLTQHTVYFDLDKDIPSASATAELTELLKALRLMPVSGIIVKGYTDKRGNNEYNNQLSQRRAENVAELIRIAGPSTINVTTEFYGKTVLLSEEETAQDRNRRVQILIEYLPAKPDDIQVEGFYEDVPEQQFVGDASDTIVVKGQKGTTIKIPPAGLQTKKGQLVKGRVTIRLKEYYDPADILLSGMHSVSDEGLLQTGGMFKVVMMQGIDTLATETKKEAEIRLPVRNESLTRMKVFTMDRRRDSARWRNSGRPFSQTYSYWAWPWSPRLEHVRNWQEVNFQRLRVGAKFRDEFDVARPLIGWGENVPSTKKVKMEIQKIDSVTIRIKAHVNYRKKGFKRLGIRSLDTTFSVSLQVAEYYAAVSNLNIINCDRFLNNKNNTEFYVQTPGFRGLNVMVYFKSQSAYMHAKDIDKKYFLARIPANEKVIIVAYGRKGQDYFFGKLPGIVTAKGNADVTPQKMSKEEFEKALNML